MAATHVTRNEWLDNPVHPVVGLAMFVAVAVALALGGMATFALVLF